MSFLLQLHDVLRVARKKKYLNKYLLFFACSMVKYKMKKKRGFSHFQIYIYLLNMNSFFKIRA